MSTTEPNWAGGSATPVVIYAARSIKNGENEQTGQQVKEIREQIAREPGERQIVAEYADDGFSGYKRDRGPQLAAARQHAARLADEHGHAELWVFQSNRLARGSGRRDEAQSLLEVFTDLRRQGVTIRSVTDDPYVTDEAFIGMAAKLANKHSADASKTIRRGQQAAWELGQWPGGQRPDGYLPDGKSLAADPERVPVLTMMFGLAAEQRPVVAIARALNAAGHRTGSGALWTRGAVRDMLQNPAYAGVLARRRGTPDEERKPGSWEPLVSLETWEAAQRVARRGGKGQSPGRPPAGRTSETHLFAALATCAQCGGRMTTANPRQRNGKRAPRYICSVSRNGSDQCSAGSVDAIAAHRYFLDRAPALIEAADRWLAELNVGHAGAADAAREAVRTAKEHAGRAGQNVDRWKARAAREQDPERLDALLDLLATARAEAKEAERGIAKAEDHLVEVEQTVGANLTASHASLTAALLAAPTMIIPALNLTLREHFAAVIITQNAEAIPLWHLAVPQQPAPAVEADVPALAAAILAAALEPGNDDEGGHPARPSTPPPPTPPTSPLIPMSSLPTALPAEMGGSPIGVVIRRST